MLEIEPSQLTNEEKWLTGSLYGSEDPAKALPALLEHVRAGRLELASMLGPSYPLEHVSEAIEASLGGATGRVLVTP
jgi:S-(hydroxymethyl)glutathione dehydrogenase/alcohol dehydrogenase